MRQYNDALNISDASEMKLSPRSTIVGWNQKDYMPTEDAKVEEVVPCIRL